MSKLDRILHEFENAGAKEKPTPFDPHAMAEEIEKAREYGRVQAVAAEAAEKEIKRLESDLEGWDESLALMRRREQPWIERWRKEEPGRDLQLPDYGQIMEWITQRAERAEAEARKFYDGDGDYKILPAEEVRAKRIACAMELTILRAETYARTTAPLSKEERAILNESVRIYEKAIVDGFERGLAMGRLHKKVEGMMQARSLVRSSAQSGMSVAAEHAIETFLPVLTKARAMKLQAEREIFPADKGLAQVVEIFETAMRKMEIMKVIADSAPRPGDGPPCRQCEGSGEVKDFHDEGPPTKVPCPGCDPAYKEAERFVEAAPDSMENCLNHPDTSWIDICTGCLATRIMRSEQMGKAMAPVLLVKARHIVKRIGAWEMDKNSGLMSIEETLEIKEDLVNAIADTKGEAKG